MLLMLRYIAAALTIWALVHLARRFIKFPAPAFLGYALGSRLRHLLRPPADVVKHAALTGGMRVLEIGCGSGPVSEAAAQAAGTTGFVCGLDLSWGMLRQARGRILSSKSLARASIALVCARADKLPFRSGTFDRTIMVAVLQELPDKRACLLEVKRVLASSGNLVVQEFLPDPDYPRLATTLHDGDSAGFRSVSVMSRWSSHIVRFAKDGSPIEAAAPKTSRAPSH